MSVRTTLDGAEARAPGGPDDGLSDGVLARRVGAGDRHAAALLVERYHEPVRRFLARLTGRADVADDLAQETFVRVLKHADRYDEKYPMRTWLLTIARRLSINHSRREAKARGVTPPDHLPGRGPTPADLAGEADERQRIRLRLEQAMTRLSEPQRHAILLFHQQGLSVQEAADIMDVPVGTVKSHLHRARAALRQIMTEPGGDST
jgi:RNA polymerase sigma-70 factor (ECF subfamily)